MKKPKQSRDVLYTNWNYNDPRFVSMKAARYLLSMQKEGLFPKDANWDDETILALEIAFQKMYPDGQYGSADWSGLIPIINIFVEKYTREQFDENREAIVNEFVACLPENYLPTDTQYAKMNLEERLETKAQRQYRKQLEYNRNYYKKNKKKLCEQQRERNAKAKPKLLTPAEILKKKERDKKASRKYYNKNKDKIAERYREKITPHVREQKNELEKARYEKNKESIREKRNTKYWDDFIA